jgi:hypothetical protein
MTVNRVCGNRIRLGAQCNRRWNGKHGAFAVSVAEHARRQPDILDIPNAQGALADAQQQHIQCLAEWRSARLRLLTATGRMGRAEIDR